MKRIVLLTLLSVGTVSAFAQTRFGIVAGLHNARYRVPDAEPPLNRKLLLLWRAGVTADIPLTGNIFLQPQLLLSRKGNSNEAHNLDSNIFLNQTAASSKMLLTYLELPVNVLYKHALGHGKLVAGGGPYLSYGLAGKVKTTATYRDLGHIPGETTVKFKNEKHPTDLTAYGRYRYYKPVDVGLNFVAGYELNNGLLFNFNYSMGLRNISPSDVGLNGSGISYSPVKTSYFGLSVGYFFKRTKSQKLREA